MSFQSPYTPVLLSSRIYGLIQFSKSFYLLYISLLLLNTFTYSSQSTSIFPNEQLLTILLHFPCQPYQHFLCILDNWVFDLCSLTFRGFTEWSKYQSPRFMELHTIETGHSAHHIHANLFVHPIVYLSHFPTLELDLSMPCLFKHKQKCL